MDSIATFGFYNSTLVRVKIVLGSSVVLLLLLSTNSYSETLPSIVCHRLEWSLIATHKRFLEASCCTVLLRLKTLDSLLLERSTLVREFLDWLLDWRWTCTNCKACCIILSKRVSSLSIWRKLAHWILENRILLDTSGGLSNIQTDLLWLSITYSIFCRFLSELRSDHLVCRSEEWIAHFSFCLSWNVCSLHEKRYTTLSSESYSNFSS